MKESYRRNFGNGRQLCWAGQQVLRKVADDKGGRFSWLRSTLSRWNKFCDFCTAQGVTDARMVTVGHVEQYAHTLRHLSAATQQNALSAINVTMTALSGSRWKKISPSKLSGTRRVNVRKIPSVITERDVANACAEIAASVGARYSYAVQIAYTFGLRRRETLLLEFHVAYKQIAQSGEVDVVRGTKGGRGRSVRREIRASREGARLIHSVCTTFPSHRCLLLGDSFKVASSQLSAEVLPILKKFGIHRFHELRVAYACRRYTEITGFEPPCNSAVRMAAADLDRDARAVIAFELGHSRIDILSAYVGSRYAH